MTALALAWPSELLVPACCLLIGCVVVSVVARRAGAPRTTVGLAELGAALLAVGVLGGVGVLPTGLGDRAGLVALLAVLPLASLWVPTGPPRLAGLVAVPVLVAVGVVLAATGAGRFVDVAELVVALVVVAAVWFRFERGDGRASGPVRDRLRWVALGLTVAMVCSIPLGFTVRGGPLVVLAGCLVVLVVPAAVVCAYVVPSRVDARALAGRTVGLLVTVVLAFAVWSGVVAGLQVLGVDTRPTWVGAGVAAAVAVGFASARRLVDTTVDLLLFGERLDPVRAASRFATELEAADDPVAVLRALRDVLGLPSAVVRDEAGQVVIGSGDAGAGPTYELPLSAAGVGVGALVLGLRPGESRPAARDRPVLRIVVPALAQLVRARGLADALAASRGRVIEAVEEDRDRLRRDLHDGLGPSLTGIAYAADAARNLLPADPARSAAVLEDLRTDATAAIGEVRRLVDGLRPAVLDELGLVAALRRHCLQLRSRGGRPVEVALDADEPLDGLGPAAELAVYRIVTEALTNVVRHSRADHAAVRIGSGPTGVDVTVHDGGGPGAAWTPGGGLRSIRERVDQLGGRLEAGPGPDGGCVRVWLPAAAG